MRVTFDSNVWRQVVSPGRFPRDPDAAVFRDLHAAAESKALKGFLAEPVVTLEAIARNARRLFLGSDRPSITVSEQINGRWSAPRVVSSSPVRHPGLNTILRVHYEDARALGFKLLQCPRVAGLKNPEISAMHYTIGPSETIRERIERFGDCAAAIEARGGGLSRLRGIGARHARPGESWLPGLLRTHMSDAEAIPEAVAEWADGDAVAAHYAYRNDFFCTFDRGRAAGRGSVLHHTNRDWLAEEWGILIRSPAQLLSELQ